MLGAVFALLPPTGELDGAPPGAPQPRLLPSLGRVRVWAARGYTTTQPQRAPDPGPGP